jgi:thiol-disulfide isomerase/thioredoxin
LQNFCASPTPSASLGARDESLGLRPNPEFAPANSLVPWTHSSSRNHGSRGLAPSGAGRPKRSWEGRLRPVARLALLPWLAALLFACDKGEDRTLTSRSEQVIATGNMPTRAPDASAAPHTESAGRSKKVCDGDGNARGRSLSKVPLAHVEAPGRAPLDGVLPAANGAWTWINFWAAWCGPCKEEMPRLVGLRDALAKAGTELHLVFISLDDDRRQLEQFLEQQPQVGLKASWWLPDGPSRASWLATLRMQSAPELPEQVLVDPAGHVRCFVEGAVDDGDYAEISALVGRP